MLPVDDVNKYLEGEAPLPKYEFDPDDYYGTEDSKRSGLDIVKFGFNPSKDGYYGNDK